MTREKTAIDDKISSGTDLKVTPIRQTCKYDGVNES